MTRIQLALAGLLAASALAAAAAQADTAERCQAKLERLEGRFRAIEAARGWDAASEWWNETGWPRYYARCGG
jgi:type II secretory pathway pseudopilin PulG